MAGASTIQGGGQARRGAGDPAIEEGEVASTDVGSPPIDPRAPQPNERAVEMQVAEDYADAGSRTMGHGGTRGDDRSKALGLRCAAMSRPQPIAARFELLGTDRLEEASALARKIFPYLDPAIAFRAAVDPTPENLQALLQTDPHDPQGMRYWIATDDESGKVLGTIGIYRYPEDRHEAVWMGWFGIAPEARGRGLGQRLLDFSVREAEQTGAKYFRLYTSDHPNEAAAQVLYEKNGFRITAREPIAGTPYTLIYREKVLLQADDEVSQPS